jgi:hypothetical protein
MTTPLNRFTFTHMAQCSLLPETIAVEEPKRIAVVSRNKDAWLALKREPQCMQEQSLSIFNCAGNPGTKGTRLCKKVSCQLAVTVAYNTCALRIVGPVGGEKSCSFGSKVRHIEDSYFGEIFLGEESDV